LRVDHRLIPAIHDRYLSKRTNEVVLVAPPDGALVAQLPDRHPLCRLISRVFVFVQFVFRPEFLYRLGSTAKRDQSFICTYPALGEGLHGRLSLGNPPALKQSVLVYREASLRRTGRLRQGPAGTRVSRIETATAFSCFESPAHPRQNPFDFLARQLVRLPTARHLRDG